MSSNNGNKDRFWDALEDRVLPFVIGLVAGIIILFMVVTIAWALKVLLW